MAKLKYKPIIRKVKTAEARKRAEARRDTKVYAIIYPKANPKKVLDWRDDLKYDAAHEWCVKQKAMDPKNIGWRIIHPDVAPDI